MTLKTIINNRTQATIGVFIVTAIFIVREYFTGGVLSHHLLANKDFPGMSNWWGLLTVPLLFWVSISIIHRRRDNGTASESNSEVKETKVFNRFLAALLFGITASLLWEFKFENFLQYFILLPMLISFFKPVHFPEYLMGFVLGMLFTFGGVLSVLAGLIILFICFLIHMIARFLVYLYSSVANRKKGKKS